jgi:hypothetical protein
MNDQTVNLTLTVNEVNVLLGALTEMPYRHVSDLIQKIVKDVQEQQAANAPAGEVSE